MTAIGGRYLELLAGACRRYGWVCHCYCLMGNHYHLLVGTPFANLHHGMRWLNGVYAIRFNRRHGVDGHLFQGRYWAEEVSERPNCCESCATSHATPSRRVSATARRTGRGRAT